ncbi:unnamed protein product [Meganyctiphanes norvegica]|uniref:Uncharacterized protein n=1 Tax=Meganyctiphanes norvegica TaxID=48144 RepID=A0AAV2PZ89_MEGNR
MDLIPTQHQLCAILFILLQFSSFIFAQQGMIELQATQKITSTFMEITPVPLLLSATSDTKIRRKVTPTPILFAQSANIVTPIPHLMNMNIESSTVFKTEFNLSPVPILPNNIQPTAALLTAMPTRNLVSSQAIPTPQRLMGKNLKALPPDPVALLTALPTRTLVSSQIIPTPQRLMGKNLKALPPDPVALLTAMPTRTLVSSQVIPTTQRLKGKNLKALPPDPIALLTAMPTRILVSSQVIPTSQRLIGKNLKALPPDPVIMATETPALGTKPDIRIGSLFSSIDSLDTIQSIKNILNFEPTKIKSISHLLNTPSTKPKPSKFSNLSKKLLNLEPSSSNNPLQNIATNQIITRQLSHNISALPIPLHVTIILSPTIILPSTNTPGASSIHNSTQINQIKDTNLLQNSNTALGSITSKSSKPINVMAQVIKPTPTLTNTPVEIFELKPKIVNSVLLEKKSLPSPVKIDMPKFEALTSKLEPSLSASFVLPHINLPIKKQTRAIGAQQEAVTTTRPLTRPIQLKNPSQSPSTVKTKIVDKMSTAKSLGNNSLSNLNPNPVNAGNHAFLLRPSPSIVQVPNIQNNQQFLPVVNRQPNSSPFIHNAILNRFNLPVVLPIQNNITPDHSSNLQSLSDHNKFIKLSGSTGNSSSVLNQTIPSLNVFTNSTSKTPAIIISNPLLRPNPSIIQVPNFQNNHQFLQVVNRQPHFSHLIRNPTLNNFNLPLVLPIQNNVNPGNLSITKRINEPNHLINSFAVRNSLSVANKTIPSLNVFPNHASRIPAIIVPNPLLRSQLFPTVPNVQNSNQLFQFLKSHPNFSPMIQNANLNNLNLPFVLPIQNNLNSGQSSITERLNDHNNSVSLSNTLSVSNKAIPSANVFPNIASRIPAIVVNNPLLGPQIIPLAPIGPNPINSSLQQNSHHHNKSLANRKFTFIPLFPLSGNNSETNQLLTQIQKLPGITSLLNNFPQTNPLSSNHSETNPLLTQIQKLQGIKSLLNKSSQTNNPSNP